MSSLWRTTQVKASASMQEAIEVLNNSVIKLVTVIDESEHLLGVITDGDIRRAILNFKALDTQVTDIMCYEPITASETDGKRFVMALLEKNKLQHIPVLNKNKQLKNIITKDSLLQKSKLNNTVFLMAGGFGTRLHPLTHSCPKPLLKIGKKPILETILESFYQHGFNNFFISVHYKAQMIKDYFSSGSRLGLDIAYVEEVTPLGTAGALSLLPEQDAPVIMMNGDLLTKVDFTELLSYHHDEQAAITMCVREHEYQVPYGVIKSNKNQVVSIVEKPTEKYFVNAGIYVISPHVIKRIILDEPLDMPDLINKCLEENDKISMFPIHEYWLDIGRMSDFERAQSDIVNFF
ncbi:alcohol dehydrogenase [Pseudoalteromonas sp. 13-15]|uniref:nucleotidyltransferase family protein n=1 Tax=Pseudoalteromonas TaxID=53246 RepID=UPI0007307F72|nr:MULTISPECIES: nucleotidyltransferase family protein [Pseudoalteromonas]AUL72145.1 alcohol dehydrogenase [Pseudoalteromonas sp. 13-15]WFO19789.1 nucleotidyltransferase family protein [Pseudoalteromonas sp. H100]SIN72665.1 CBS domain-containing protein [Pseudoalteromonas marina]